MVHVADQLRSGVAGVARWVHGKVMTRLTIKKKIRDTYLYGYYCTEGGSGIIHEVDPYAANGIGDDLELLPGDMIDVDEDSATVKVYLPSADHLRLVKP